jgi:hypothetical protein
MRNIKVKGVWIMKWLDITVRTVVFVIAFTGVFYIIPKVMISDIIQEFRKVFGKQPEQKKRVEMSVYKKKKKLWDTRSIFNIKA